jgi:hypothetical protein
VAAKTMADIEEQVKYLRLQVKDLQKKLANAERVYPVAWKIHNALISFDITVKEDQLHSPKRTRETISEFFDTLGVCDPYKKLGKKE